MINIKYFIIFFSYSLQLKEYFYGLLKQINNYLFKQDDAKINIKEIAHRLNLSTTPIFERIKKLEENKVITGYHAQINKEALDLSLMVFCAITLKEHHADYLKKFETDIINLDEVLSCYHLGGNSDYLLQVVVSDINSYITFSLHKTSQCRKI